MTVVEKAAYLKGLAEGLGVTPDSKEGKLWAALNDLLSDMAHEIEDFRKAILIWPISSTIWARIELSGGADLRSGHS
ncbi:MAG: CD1247 N-terminal domain-containing protein [Oscillospiraceae bacterium]